MRLLRHFVPRNDEDFAKLHLYPGGAVPAERIGITKCKAISSIVPRILDLLHAPQAQTIVHTDLVVFAVPQSEFHFVPFVRKSAPVRTKNIESLANLTDT